MQRDSTLHHDSTLKRNRHCSVTDTAVDSTLQRDTHCSVTVHCSGKAHCSGIDTAVGHTLQRVSTLQRDSTHYQYLHQWNTARTAMAEYALPH